MRVLFTISSAIFLSFQCKIVASFSKPRYHCCRRRTLVITAGGSGEVEGKYSWSEDDEELEVKLRVPASTSAEDVRFDLSQKRIMLKLASMDKPLIAGELRGKVTTDGSYWSLEAREETGAETERLLVLRLEKKSDGMYDPEEWMGVILDASEQNAKLDYNLHEKEEFNIDEYIESMGGYDESLVDKNMFSGLAKDIFDDMMDKGLIKDNIQDSGENTDSLSRDISDSTVQDAEFPGDDDETRDQDQQPRIRVE